MATTPGEISRPTQASIAQDLRLSQATVSNALAGRRHQCSARSYARIWAHVAAVGYRGRGLTPEANPVRELREVGLVLGSGVAGSRPTPWASAVQWATEEALALRGIATVQLGGVGRLREAVLRGMGRSGGRKPVLVVVGGVSEFELRALRESAHRIVTIGSHHAHLAPGVLGGEMGAAELLVAHLSEQGHRTLAWLGGGGDRLAIAGRRTALGAAAANGGVEISFEAAGGADGPPRSAGHEAARAFLRQRVLQRATAPTAVVCSDAGVARGALEEFRRAGVAVPGEVSVVAMDGTQACTEEEPTLAAAGASPDKLGETAVDLLTNFPDATDGKFPRTVVPARFTPGATTGPVELTGGKATRGRVGRRLATVVAAFEPQRLTG